jgi:hypothetical protein
MSNEAQLRKIESLDPTNDMDRKLLVKLVNMIESWDIRMAARGRFCITEQQRISIEIAGSEIDGIYANRSFDMIDRNDNLFFYKMLSLAKNARHLSIRIAALKELEVNPLAYSSDIADIVVNKEEDIHLRKNAIQMLVPENHFELLDAIDKDPDDFPSIKKMASYYLKEMERDILLELDQVML